MKKVILTIAMTACMGVALAGELQNNVGAGLGTVIFEGQDGLISQVCAATTNGLYGNQTFAITSGTSNATRPDSLVQNESLERFVRENMDALAADIATGKGETLGTLVELMAVPKPERAAFQQHLQSNFGKIYASADVPSVDVLKALDTLTKG